MYAIAHIEMKRAKCKTKSMTAKKAAEWVEQELERNFIYPSQRNKPWPASQYFSRFDLNRLNIRVADHESKYPRNWCSHIILKDSITLRELKRLTAAAVVELTVEEELLAKEDGIL